MYKPAIIFIFALSLSSAFAAKKPNILFILADDLGWSDTTLYGQTKFYETPHLERLAARGMTFDRAYTASPLCSPTRSSILTGLHPARTGLTAPNCHTAKIVLKATAANTGPSNRKLTAYSSVTRLDTKYETLGKRLQSEGWKTGHFGKWHLGAEPYSPLEHGFDVDIPHWHGPGPAGSFVAPWKFPEFKEKYPKEHLEDRMGDEAVAFMEKHQAEPFFLNYWQFSVHAPFDAKAELIEKYRAEIDPNDEQRSPTYAAMVQSLDDNVGKILDALDRLKLTENTIIIFYSDNGGNMYNEIDGTTPTSNRPLRGGKANNWDGGTRVPAVVVWPGVIKAGSRNSDLITSTDFYPTLLELTGLKPSLKQSFDGISIVPALKGGTLDRERIYTFFPHSTRVPDTLPPSAAVYQGDWKLFRFFHDGPSGSHRHSLYHLAEDIGERNDLSSQEPERLATMSAAMDEFITNTGAVYPKTNPFYDASVNLLNQAGWKAHKSCALSVVGEHVKVTAREAKANFNIHLSPLVGTGKLMMRVRIKSNHPGKIHLRWEEKGVKPVYFSDRLVHTDGYLAEQWKTIDIPFTAKNPVASFRVDFMQPPGIILIDKVELFRGKTVLRTWEFSVTDKE
ncbi:MAG: sulfatase [Rubritalea sp.]|tara:strand:+ start:15492 stop:17354 length:1863 start_codon:yes stop_codon:yes gene_type:complete